MSFLFILLTLKTNPMGNPVSAHIWKQRVLIVTASSPSNIGYKRQNQLLERGKKGMKERDLVIYRLYSDHWVGPQKNPLSHKEAASIYSTYNIGETTFSVVLIGKDGGVKMRSEDIVSTRELFQLIDSMPMRMQEMQQQKESGF